MTRGRTARFKNGLYGGEGARRTGFSVVGAGKLPAVFCLLLALCLALAGSGQTARAANPAERYTKDKIKTSLPPAAAVSAEPAAAAQPAPAPAPAAVPEPAVEQAPPGAASGGPLKSPAPFNECVRVALAQSPLLTKSSLEIESRRLDVGDAYSQFIPTIIMNTTFYMRLPQYKNTAASSAGANILSSASSNPVDNLNNATSQLNSVRSSDPNKNRKYYDLSFSTGAWNPILSAFDVQAKREMVNIAVLGHLKVINTGLKRLGTTFLQLGMLDNQLKLTKEKEDMAAKYLEYAKTKAQLGQSAQLDVRIAETKLSIVKAEADKIKTTRAMLMDDLKFTMGVPFVQKVDLELANATGQVLDDFNPATVTDEKLRAHSFDLRIHEYEKALQKKNIALAYVHFLPTFSFGFTSVSTLNSSTYKDSSALPFMYPNLSLAFPMDWWTKGRDVARQYKKMSQLNVEGKNIEFKLMSEFQSAMARLRSTNSDVKYATANVELSKLQSQQAQFRYDSGQVEYDAIVKAMDEYIDARQKALLKEYDRDVALLDCRFIAGDFQDRYINTSIMENM